MTLDDEATHDARNRNRNARKREVYWVGFLDGTLSSKRIERGEEDAISTEALAFAEFFNDPDANDLFEDLQAECFDGEQDLMDQLREVVLVKRSKIVAAEPYSETDRLNEFLGFCAGIVCDGLILESEARAILERFRRDQVLRTSPAFNELRRALEAALADNVLTEEESEDLRQWIARLVGDGFIDTGLPNIGVAAELGPPITDPLQIQISAASFCLTGPMSMGPRSFILSEIARCGGRATNGPPNRSTDYVVVSLDASRHWKTTHFGTKIERAKMLIEEGHPLRFVSEVALAEAIRLLDDVSARPEPV